MRRPSTELVASYLDLVAEMRELGETIWEGTVPRPSEPPADFVHRLLRAEDRPEPGLVPQSSYWAVADGVVVGRIALRHHLNEDLEQFGGHIGYDIRPGKRGRGYGNKILELALKKAKEMGIEKVRITCDVDNVPSRKIIEKNGGMLENEAPNPETGVNKARFWIENK